MKSNFCMPLVMIFLSCLIALLNITAASAISNTRSNDYISNPEQLKISARVTPYNTDPSLQIPLLTPAEIIKKAIALSQSRDYINAIKYYDKALTTQPNNTGLLINKGNALSQVGNYSARYRSL